jgi:uncharacterized protein
MSAARPTDPRRLDMVGFAIAAGRLSGDWPLSELPRLQQDALPLGKNSPNQSVCWSAIGERRAASGGDDEIRLRLHASTALQLTCQRCLQPMTVNLDVQPTIRFVYGEVQAQALDENSDEDVLALPPSLDLRALIEDELILALPLIPRHDACPLPLSAGSAELADGGPEARPFAALAALRRGDKGGGKAS